jgi:hypothetical protein
MFNSPVLELVILLSFTYFVCSLLLTAINEAIAGSLRLRPKQLKVAIYNMFFDKEWKAFVRDHFNQTPVIQSLMKSKGRYPAYISATSFVQALVAAMKAEYYNADNLMKEFTGDSKLPESVKTMLKGFWVQSQGNITEFEKKIEGFYNNAMDRATGWYKKSIRRISFVAGFLLAFALNVDTIKIANDAFADKNKLSKAADNIAASIGRLDSAHKMVVTDTSINLEPALIKQQATATLLEYKQTTGFELGYQNFAKEWDGKILIKLLGLLITTFALQLGSNYWFDIMNKAVNIRAAGKKPGVDDKEKSTTK